VLAFAAAVVWLCSSETSHRTRLRRAKSSTAFTQPDEQRRRSVATLAPDVPAGNRDEALELLEQLRDALQEIKELRHHLG
jgi:hypothetical protein